MNPFYDSECSKPGLRVSREHRRDGLLKIPTGLRLASDVFTCLFYANLGPKSEEKDRSSNRNHILVRMNSFVVLVSPNHEKAYLNMFPVALNCLLHHLLGLKHHLWGLRASFSFSVLCPVRLTS
jgi:hypothetical protein